MINSISRAIDDDNKIIDAFFSPLLKDDQKKEILNLWKRSKPDVGLNLRLLISCEESKFQEILKKMELFDHSEDDTIRNIRSLYLQGSSFNFLSSDIGRFSKIKHLKLTSNNLFCLPQEIEKLSLLEEISLRENVFGEIPPVLLSKKMKNLKVIDLAINHLLVLPKQVPKNIQQIIVGCNPIAQNPPEIKGFTYDKGVYTRQKESCTIL